MLDSKSLTLQRKVFYFYCRIGDEVSYLKYIPLKADMVLVDKTGDMLSTHLPYNDVLHLLGQCTSVGDGGTRVCANGLKIVVRVFRHNGSVADGQLYNARTEAKKLEEVHEMAVSDREDAQMVKAKKDAKDASWETYVNIRDLFLKQVDVLSTA